MKKIIYTIGFILLIGIVTDSQLSAQKIINVGFGLGLSTPNDKLSDVYNSSRFPGLVEANQMFTEGVATGYHFGMKVRSPLNDNVTFVGGIGYNRFPQYEIKVDDPIADTTFFSLAVVSNIVPISAGLNYYIINDVIGIYGIGELAYSYIFSSIDYPDELYSYPIETLESDSRIGFGAGVGFDINFELLLVNIEAKYNNANLIGQVEDEETKSYVTFGLMVFF